MAVVENAATVDLGINDRTTFENISGHPHSNFSDDQNLHHHLYPHQSDDDINGAGSTVLVTHDQSSLYLKPCSHFHRPPTASMVQLQQSNVEGEMPGFEHQQLQQQRSSDGGRDFKVDSKEIDGLVDMFSNLNPLAAEFVPPSLSNPAHHFRPGYYMNYGDTNPQQNNGRQKKGNNVPGKRRMNNRTNQAQREYVIRRTVYVSDIDQQVTEEQLATLFVNCGQVVDCRICGDPNSVLRFAFVEFTDEEGALAALSLSGTMLGYYPVKVLPSKTAIAPVNPNYLPRSEDEREMCARTIYCTNIDKKVGQNELRLFFESVCGEVHRLRLLGDYQHSTRIAFVEFVMAESAIAALNCSGVVLGSLPIRVSPSKTPVRPRAPRQTGN